MKEISMVGILFIFLFIISPSSGGLNYTIFPNPAIIGGDVNIQGDGAKNGEDLFPSINYIAKIKVQDNNYNFESSGIQIPQNNNGFSIKAYPVTTLYIKAKPSWFPVGYSKDGKITGDVGSYSYGNIRVSKIDVRIYGTSNKDEVILSITNSVKINADDSGKFNISYNTTGLKLGTYYININGKKQTFLLKSSAEDFDENSDFIPDETYEEISALDGTNNRDPESMAEIAEDPQTIESESEKESLFQQVLKFVNSLS